MLDLLCIITIRQFDDLVAIACLFCPNNARTSIGTDPPRIFFGGQTLDFTTEPKCKVSRPFQTNCRPYHRTIQRQKLPESRHLAPPDQRPLQGALRRDWQKPFLVAVEAPWVVKRRSRHLRRSGSQSLSSEQSRGPRPWTTIRGETTSK